MVQHGFTQSVHDHSFFDKRRDYLIIVLLVYVDDIVISGNDSASIEALKCYLCSNFTIKDLGPLKFFLGLEVAQSKHGICLNQRKYALELIFDAGMVACKPYNAPMEHHLKLTTSDFDVSMASTLNSSVDDSLIPDLTVYQRLIGILIYLTITYPDICFPMQHLIQFIQLTKTFYLRVSERIIGYLI